MRFLTNLLRQDYVSLTLFSEESKIKSIQIPKSILFLTVTIVIISLIGFVATMLNTYRSYQDSLKLYENEENLLLSRMDEISNYTEFASETVLAINHLISDLLHTLPYSHTSGSCENNDFGSLRRNVYDKPLFDHSLDNFPESSLIISSYLSNIMNDLITTSQNFDAILDRIASVPEGLPIKGRLASQFGLRQSPFTETAAIHRGIDIVNEKDTPIMAPGDGVISFAGEKRLWGNTIIIDHKYEVLTQYGHLNSIFVKKGVVVKRGDIIGTVGSTGRSTGPHLHYQIWVDNEPADPMLFIAESEQNDLRIIDFNSKSLDNLQNIGGGSK